MDELMTDVWTYFTPVTSTFWSWAPDQQAIVWNGGETIVFREELATLIEVFSSIGLPPLDSILLTIATCRSSAATTLPQLPERLNFTQFPLQHSLMAQLENLRSQLWVLSNLPLELRSSIEGKRTILTLMAENGPRLSAPEFAVVCIDWLRQGHNIKYSPGASSHTRSTGEWSILFRGLQDGLASVNEGAVRLRMRTGLEPADVPTPIPLALPDPLPPSRTVWELLQEFEEDDEYSGLCRIVKRLLSVVTIPRPLTAPAELPLGGVSDITNRGPFDRLLLSELAHDVDVLMTRVALNEALYIRREVPPTLPPRNRLVLLDAGIRMWGLPRLYASAVALTLAVNQNPKAITRIFLAENETVVPCPLNSRDDFLELLEVLELPTHPGKALPAFAAEADVAPADFVLVTGEDVVADPEFRRCLSEQKFSELYLVVVNREGELRLIHRTRQGERLLKQVKLDLEELLQPAPKKKLSLRDPKIPDQLPAIFRAIPFPLQLTHKSERGNSGTMSLPGNPAALVSVTVDRRLMLWHTKKQWARQLGEGLPPGDLVWNSRMPDAEGLIRILISAKEPTRVCLITAAIDGTKCQVTPLEFIPPETLAGVAEFAGILHLVYPEQTQLYSVRDGRLLLNSCHHDDGRSWIRDRFYKGPQGCEVLAFDGHQAQWQIVLPDSAVKSITVKTLFDCEALAVPVAITKWNEFIATGSLEAIKFQSKYLSVSTRDCEEKEVGRQATGYSNWKLTSITGDGNHLRLSDGAVVNGVCKFWEVDLSRRTATEVYSGSRDRGLLNLHPPHLGNHRTKFSAVGVHAGVLSLVTHKQQVVSIVYHPYHRDRRLSLVPSSVNRNEISLTMGFREVKLPRELGYELKVATSNDGSRVFLDSRGLLHLKSSDPNLAELTLVLHDQQISGWCDRNQVWGDAACIGVDQSIIDPGEAYQKWLVPFCQRLT